MSRGQGKRRRQRVWARALVWSFGLGALGAGGFTLLSRLGLGDPADFGLEGTALATMQQLQTPPPPVTPRAEKVKITFTTQPPGIKTELRWGKRKLGIVNLGKKAFFIERPKDSGPMDIVARAEGFLPLNTRVFTYNDNKVLLTLTPEADKHTLLGYKVPVPDGGADGGVPDGGVLPAVAPIGPQPAPLPQPPLQPLPPAP